MLVRRMVHLPVAARPDGRVVARWVMRVAPAGTAPVVTQVVATQCTLPLITTADAAVVGAAVGAAVGVAVGAAVGVTALDHAEAAPVPVAFVAAARNR